MTDKRIVLTTAGSEDEARNIARHLVEESLAACVNIVPQVTSIYRWKNEVEEGREWLLVVKTTVAAVGLVQKRVLELHSYDVPECISLTIEDGSTEYLEWIAGSIAAKE